MVQIQRLFSFIFCFILLTAATQASQDACTVYIHGYTGNPDGAKEQKEAFSDPEQYQAPALPDTQPETGVGPNRWIAAAAQLWKKKINLSQAFMGQGPDVKVLYKHVQKNLTADQPFVFFGICRGGCAAINYVAKYNPQNLKALVIESTPASMPALLHAKMAKAGLSLKYDEKFFRALFHAYPKNSTPPIQAIKKIKNKKLPILILHSKNDQNIPFEHALMLYLAFKEQGFENVHLSVLYGKHAYLLQEDKGAYLTVVHSFYKQYGLKHNPFYATKTMESYAYDIVQAQKEVDIYEKQLAQQLQKTHKKMAMSTGLMGASVYAWNYLIGKNKSKRSATAA